MSDPPTEEDVLDRGEREPEQEDTMSGVIRIEQERRRQIEEEGWTPEHDDQHEAGELSVAGKCYAGYAAYQTYRGEDKPEVRHLSTYTKAGVPVMWPWDDSWWKPAADRVRNLEKAGALIAAEIDRIQRQNSLPVEKRSGA